MSPTDTHDSPAESGAEGPGTGSTATASTDPFGAIFSHHEAPAEEETEDATEETAAEPEQRSAAASPFGLVFQAPDLSTVPPRPTRRRPVEQDDDTPEQGSGSDSEDDTSGSGDGSSRSGGRGGRGRGGRASGGGDSRGGRGDAGADDTDGDDTGSDRASDGSQDSGPDDGADGDDASGARRRRRRGGKGRRTRGSGDGSGEDQGQGQAQEQAGRGRGGEDDSSDSTRSADGSEDQSDSGSGSSVRRRRRSNRRGEDGEARESRRAREEVTGVRGSTRLEAKRQRRREGREAGRRRTIITEAEFLARRESVERTMVVRSLDDRTQIGVLEDGVLVEHYVSRSTQTTMVGNVYLGRVQNVLPSMEAAFVDIGKGRNAVLYAGEVNWDAAGLESNQPKRIENALKSGDPVLVQVTKDPIGHKGARLTSQVSLPGRYLVLVPGNSMTGISRKLPDTERTRLKKILKEVVPEGAGVIVRTAAEGASEEELRADVERLTGMWERIKGKQKKGTAPSLLHGEPDMTVRVIRDVFNEDFAKVVVSGDKAWSEVSEYINGVAPDLADRLEKWTGTQDVFTHYRVTEALTKAMDRKVWLPSGGSLVIDRTEAMTVVDVNTGKFIGSGGNLEETVTKNNIEAAEEIVRQLRLRDIGGIIVIDFIDMVLESNRDLVVRRLLECLGRDRTKHQVAEVTSLGLVQMTRKRVGAGLIEVFSEPCTHCNGRGIHVHSEPVVKSDSGGGGNGGGGGRGRGRGRGGSGSGNGSGDTQPQTRPTPNPAGPTPAQIAAAAHAAAVAGSAKDAEKEAAKESGADAPKASRTADTAPATTSPGSEGTAVTTAPPVTAPAPVTPPAPVTAPAPAPRPRRRRGRVVAPAGPPSAAPDGAATEPTPSTSPGDHTTGG